MQLVNIRKLIQTLGMIGHQDPSAIKAFGVTQSLQPVYDTGRIGNIQGCRSYIGQNENSATEDLITTYDMVDSVPVWPTEKDMYVYAMGFDQTSAGINTGKYAIVLQPPGETSLDLAISQVFDTNSLYNSHLCFGFVFDDILPAYWHLGIKLMDHFGTGGTLRPIVIAKPIIRP